MIALSDDEQILLAPAHEQITTVAASWQSIAAPTPSGLSQIIARAEKRQAKVTTLYNRGTMHRLASLRLLGTICLSIGSLSAQIGGAGSIQGTISDPSLSLIHI